MLRKLFMTNISIKHDTDLHLDKVPTIDLTAFYRYDSLYQTDKKEMTLDLFNLSKGIYYLKLNIENKTQVQKIIVL